MKKQFAAVMLVLALSLSGCSAIPDSPDVLPRSPDGTQAVMPVPEQSSDGRDQEVYVRGETGKVYTTEEEFLSAVENGYIMPPHGKFFRLKNQPERYKLTSVSAYDTGLQYFYSSEKEERGNHLSFQWCAVRDESRQYADFKREYEEGNDEFDRIGEYYIHKALYDGEVEQRMIVWEQFGLEFVAHFYRGVPEEMVEEMIKELCVFEEVAIQMPTHKATSKGLNQQGVFYAREKVPEGYRMYYKRVNEEFVEFSYIPSAPFSQSWTLDDGTDFVTIFWAFGIERNSLESEVKNYYPPEKECVKVGKHYIVDMDDQYKVMWEEDGWTCFAFMPTVMSHEQVIEICSMQKVEAVLE